MSPYLITLHARSDGVAAACGLNHSGTFDYFEEGGKVLRSKLSRYFANLLEKLTLHQSSARVVPTAIDPALTVVAAACELTGG